MITNVIHIMGLEAAGKLKMPGIPAAVGKIWQTLCFRKGEDNRVQSTEQSSAPTVVRHTAAGAVVF